MKLTHKQYPGIARALGSAVALLSSTFAFAGGYEKPVFFSGHYAGIGGAAVSSVSGAEALYFNPAGLAAGDSTMEISGNFSPTVIHFSGPIAGNQLDSNSSFAPEYGAFVSYKPSPKWGIGFGSYLAGGARAIYDGVGFANAPTVVNAALPASTNFGNANATIQSNLSIVEFALGTGYEVMDGLRVGADWRVAYVKAALSSYGYNPLATGSPLQTLTIDGISGSRWNGFRFGVQYYPKESRWGLGAEWRTEVGFTGTGTLNSTLTTNSAIGAVPAGSQLQAATADATASNTLPQSFDIGGHYDIIPNGLRMYLQYTYTNYSVDQTLDLAGNAVFTLPAAAGGSTVTSTLSNIPQNWNNEHDLRVAFDCFEVPNWVFRAAYVFSSEVTPKDRARATFLPPGPGHTITLGTGTKLTSALEADLALEYAWSSATVTTADSPNPPASDQSSGRAGDYKAYDYAAHVGLTYRL